MPRQLDRHERALKNSALLLLRQYILGEESLTSPSETPETSMDQTGENE